VGNRSAWEESRRPEVQSSIAAITQNVRCNVPSVVPFGLAVLIVGRVVCVAVVASSPNGNMRGVYLNMVGGSPSQPASPACPERYR